MPISLTSCVSPDTITHSSSPVQGQSSKTVLESLTDNQKLKISAVMCEKSIKANEDSPQNAQMEKLAREAVDNLFTSVVMPKSSEAAKPPEQPDELNALYGI
jgi:hypothetical protein